MIKVRDVVVSKSYGKPLRCGSGIYDKAIVISTEPFVMTSWQGDMRWSATFTAEDVKKVGRAPLLRFLKVWWTRKDG